MSDLNFVFDSTGHKLPEKAKFTWRAPSNIALVKYWGKEEVQLPKNPSLSFTLNACFSLTSIAFTKNSEPVKSKDKDRISSTYKGKLNFYFEGNRAPSFEPKLFEFFKRISHFVPFLGNYNLLIHSRNSFPHSSGIASSASSMAALALCIMSLEKEMNPGMTEEYFNKKASFLARLGSGSACRSIQGELVVWGEHKNIKGSSDLFGLPYNSKLNPVFKQYHDTILLVDKGEKAVSSSLGHKLMHKHPYAKNRFKQARKNLTALSRVLQNGDLDKFIHIVESEALSLHAMMMSSDPYFILIKPNTLHIIQKVWEFRAQTNSKLCFTLDAGANVHLLFPESETKTVNAFIISELLKFCQNNQYICDSVGTGAKQM